MTPLHLTYVLKACCIPVVTREASDAQQSVAQGSRCRPPPAICELIDDEGPLSVLEGVYPVDPDCPWMNLQFHDTHDLAAAWKAAWKAP